MVPCSRDCRKPLTFLTDSPDKLPSRKYQRSRLLTERDKSSLLCVGRGRVSSVSQTRWLCRSSEAGGRDRDAEENPDTTTREDARTRGREAAGRLLGFLLCFHQTAALVFPLSPHMFSRSAWKQAAQRHPVKVEVGDEVGDEGGPRGVFAGG